MAVVITTDTIDKDEVVITMDIRMKFNEWKAFYQELPSNQPMCIQVRDGLKAQFDRINNVPTGD